MLTLPNPSTNGHPYVCSPLEDGDPGCVISGGVRPRASTNPKTKEYFTQTRRGPGGSLETRSQFAKVAMLISINLYVACGHLESHRLLAPQRTLFYNHLSEEEHVNHLIRDDIYST